MTRPPYLEPSLVDLLSELVNSGVGRGAHQDGASSLLHQLVHNGCGGNSLPCAWWTLDQGKRALQGVLQCILLERSRQILVILRLGKILTAI